MNTMGKKSLCLLYISVFFSSATAFSVSKEGARQPTSLFSSSSETFRPMSRVDVENWLATVPVYAVLDETQGLVLLQEEGNEKEIANFFLSPETAQSLYSPIKQKNEGVNWDISQLGLAQVWFDIILANEAPDVEYRLIPDPKQLETARKMVEQNSPNEPPEIFKARYNEILLFLDQRLRVKTESGEDKVPMYLSLQNCMSTCQQAMEASSDSDYQSEISVAELTSLLDQMQTEKAECDFRETVLIPPMPEIDQKKETSSAKKPDGPQLMSTDDLWD